MAEFRDIKYINRDFSDFKNQLMILKLVNEYTLIKSILYTLAMIKKRAS